MYQNILPLTHYSKCCKIIISQILYSKCVKYIGGFVSMKKLLAFYLTLCLAVCFFTSPSFEAIKTSIYPTEVCSTLKKKPQPIRLAKRPI